MMPRIRSISPCTLPPLLCPCLRLSPGIAHRIPDALAEIVRLADMEVDVLPPAVRRDELLRLVRRMPGLSQEIQEHEQESFFPVLHPLQPGLHTGREQSLRNSISDLLINPFLLLLRLLHAEVQRLHQQLPCLSRMGIVQEAEAREYHWRLCPLTLECHDLPWIDGQ